MKFLLSLIATIMAFSTPIAVSASKNKTTPISQKSIGKHGYTITKPGKYYLKEDIMYSPKGTNPAIRISSKAGGNVTLNLKKHTLSQKSKSNAGVNGIVVDPGLDNVSIINGTVRDFSQDGIQAGIQRSPGLTTPATITNLTIRNINALNNGLQNAPAQPTPGGTGGIAITNAQNVILDECNCNQNVLAGFFGVDVAQMSITNSHFDNNTWGNLDNGFQGLPIQVATAGFYLISDACGTGQFCDQPSANALVSGNLIIKGCTFNENESVGEVFGLYLTTTGFGSAFNTVLIDSCTANGNNSVVSNPDVAANYSNGMNATAFAMLGGFGKITFTNCQASQTSLILNTTIPLAEGSVNEVLGIAIEFAQGPISVTNCNIGSQIAQNNSGEGTAVFNSSLTIYETSQDIYIANCQLSGNANLPPANGSSTPTNSLLLVEGLDMAGVGNVLIENCFSGMHTQAASSGPFSFAAGFKISFQPNFITGTVGSATFKNCVASGNTDTGGNGGGAYGFTTRDSNVTDENLGFNYVFESCIAENNSNGTGGGFGFDIFNLQNAKVICNYAEGNDVGINVSDFAPNQSSDNVISGNILVANNNYGILDTGAASDTNAYFQNTAKDNGSSPCISGSDTNFSGGILNTTGSPIRYWLLPNPPNFNNNNGVHGEILDNISINL